MAASELARRSGVRLIRAAEYRRMPWKNGGGATAEIAVAPDGADAASFAWRLSMAEIARLGPFSTFPGIDRTLLLLAGGSLHLAVGAAAPVVLTPGAPPMAFDGGQLVTAKPASGPATVLNVMTRRGLARHALGRLVVDGPMPLDPAGGETLLFCHSGSVRIDGPAGSARLAASDTLHLGRGAGRLALTPLQSAVLWRIDVFPDAVGWA